jgi:hypothetical protein
MRGSYCRIPAKRRKLIAGEGVNPASPTLRIVGASPWRGDRLAPVLFRNI